MYDDLILQKIKCIDIPGICKNGGTCTDTQEGFQCLCPRWLFKGRTCETPVTFNIIHATTGKYVTVTGKENSNIFFL